MRRSALVILLAFFSCLSFAQGTTPEEYTYLKKGLQSTFDQGLDVKRGYYLEDIEIGYNQLSGTTTVAKNLRRTKDKSFVGTWIKINVTGTWSGDGNYIFCIPSPSPGYGVEWQELFLDINKPSQETANKAFLRFLTWQYSLELANSKAGAKNPFTSDTTTTVQ